MKSLPNIDDLKQVREIKRKEVLKRIKKETRKILKDTGKLSVRIHITNNCGGTSFHEPIQRLYRELMSESAFCDYYRGNITEMEKQTGEVYCEMFNDEFGFQGYKAVRSGI